MRIGRRDVLCVSMNSCVDSDYKRVTKYFLPARVLAPRRLGFSHHFPDLFILTSQTLSYSTFTTTSFMEAPPFIEAPGETVPSSFSS